MILKYKITLIFGLFFTVSILLRGEELQKNATKSNFTNEALLNPLFKKLYRLESKHQGKVNIVHIGDSHIQADLFTNVIRQDLQTRFGNGGYGFTFPYKLAKTNGNTYITYTSDIDWKSRRNIYPITDVSIGLSGIGFYTDQKMFQLTIKSTPLYLFNRVKLLYPSMHSQFKLSEDSNFKVLSKSVSTSSKKVTKAVTHKVRSGETLSQLSRKYKVSVNELKRNNGLKSDKIRIGAILKIKKSVVKEEVMVKVPVDYSILDKINFIDSDKSKTRPYMSVFNLSQLSNQVSIYPDASSSNQDYSLSGIVLENDNPGIVYNAIGVNGATISDYNKYPLFFQQLPALEPDLIIISLGTNESFGKWSTPYFRTEMQSFIDQVKTYNPRAIILLMSPPPSLFKRRVVNNFIEEYGKVLQSMDGCVYWDFLHKLGGAEAPLQKDFQSYMARDKVHYTKEGYEMQGDLFYNDFLSAYTNFIKKDTIGNGIELY